MFLIWGEIFSMGHGHIFSALLITNSFISVNLTPKDTHFNGSIEVNIGFVNWERCEPINCIFCRQHTPPSIETLPGSLLYIIHT